MSASASVVFPSARATHAAASLRLPSLCALAVRIHQVIQRVELLEHGVCVPRGDRGSTVGPDRLLPEPEADEDVRRHVLRMGARRRDLRVAARRRQGSIPKQGIVVAVDDVVGDARMVRLLSEYFLENLAGLLLVRVRLVSWERRCVQREGVEHRRLAVLRIADVQTLHRLFVGEAARAVLKLVGISIERLDRGDVVSLAFGARPEGLRLFHGHPPLLEGTLAWETFNDRWPSAE